ncbi:MAG: PQQ-dependent sugar dehydrogenase [Deinococcota bacterium]|nr:PQQ-dependent sugar dehydrogenase [Deinococcota bacterium]
MKRVTINRVIVFTLMLLLGFLGLAAAQEEADEAPEAQVNTVEGTAFIPAQLEASEERIGGLQLPEGFEISVFAEGFERPRMMAQGEDGAVFVTLQEAGEVVALRDSDGDGQADDRQTVASELEGVHGVAIHEGRLYLANPTTVWVGDLPGEGEEAELEVVIDDLPDGGQHGNRTMRFGPDGMLYINVGSSCNSCPETNEEHATILQVEPDGSSREIFASGLRNTLGFDWHPETGEMWGMDMGADWRGDDSPPDELNLIEAGNDYGWPYCYADRQPDLYIPYPPPDESYDDLAAYCEAETVGQVIGYQAHSSPINFVFYTAESFPEDYRGHAFVTMRGSWNRQPPVGYKVVLLRFENGEPSEFEDFITGWLLEDGQAQFGRIAGLLVMQDGSLLIAEDTGGVIYRVSYDAGGQ